MMVWSYGVAGGPHEGDGRLSMASWGHLPTLRPYGHEPWLPWLPWLGPKSPKIKDGEKPSTLHIYIYVKFPTCQRTIPIHSIEFHPMRHSFSHFSCDLRSYCMNSYMFAKERSWASATWRAQGANAMGALVSWHPKRWRDVKILGSQHTAEWQLWLTLDAKKEIWLWSCIQLKNEVLLRQKGANKNWQRVWFI